MCGEDLRVIDEALRPGDVVQISDGAMSGLQAVVMRVMPARQRVAILIDFLGRQTAVELDRRSLTFVTEEESHRVRAPVWQSATQIMPALG
jgi:transcription antitermination factor NusG